MHVLLVGAELEENLALRYLAAALEKRGHRASFATFDRASDGPTVLDAVARETPDVVGMSMTFQFRAHEFGALASSLREHGFRGHVTVGGHFPTFAWREVLDAFPAVDSVVRHEGEVTLPELCATLAAGGAALGCRGRRLPRRRRRAGVQRAAPAHRGPRRPPVPRAHGRLRRCTSASPPPSSSARAAATGTAPSAASTPT